MPWTSTCRLPRSRRKAVVTLIRTIRLSDEVVWKIYSHRSFAKFGEISRPSSPPSPLVLTAPGTEPTVLFAPVAGLRSRSGEQCGAEGCEADEHGQPTPANGHPSLPL